MTEAAKPSVADARDLKEAWQGYAAVIPPDAPNRQVVETRRAFYAGAWALFCLLMETTTDERDDGVSKIDDLRAEMVDFRDLVARDGDLVARVVLCAWQDCEKPATKQPHFIIRPRYSETRSDGYLSVGVCDEHATVENANGLMLSPPNRRGIETGFANSGLAAPDWPRCYAEWIPIAEVPEQWRLK